MGEENFLSANPNIYARPTRTALLGLLSSLDIQWFFFHKTAKILHFFSFFLEIYFYTSFLYTRNVEKKEREKGNRIERETERKGSGKMKSKYA